MALTVAPEDNFDSLLSLADADAYWAGLNQTAWDNATVPAKERALRIATNYLWARNLREAAWYPEVHVNLENATAEAALRVLQGKIGRDPDPAPVVQKTVGPVTLRYADPGDSVGSQPRFQVIEDMLHGLTVSGSPWGNVTLERV